MKKILVIDDNHMIRNSVSSYLNCALKGYTVLSAEDGQRGIELMRLQPVSLILTDLEMPNKDGYQVIDYAKKHHPDVPVIIMTGSWSSDLKALVSKTGVARCLEKPFRFEELNEMILEALRYDEAVPTTASIKLTET
jgi:DNA-binding NtrC family response regulator